MPESCVFLSGPETKKPGIAGPGVLLEGSAQAVCTDVISAISSLTIGAYTISAISGQTICTNVISAIGSLTVWTYTICAISQIGRAHV